eukprot:2407800-Alexandrium_andersonii.AAC.1
MSASLVGSEMCIRDRASTACTGTAQLVVPVDDSRLGARRAFAAGSSIAAQPQQACAPTSSASYHLNCSL